ncbi:hypothetical protein [Vulcanisaeta souniana]|uniref:hypothetical protein n=1 Tax=Vulcanisaeta souniana TaxID=164452 RepID=UPI000AE740C8|nr:hypothetical protein [Vulcanisaeta souniana]
MYGGSTDCSGGDIDITVFMEEVPSEIPRVSGNVDLQVFRRPPVTPYSSFI